MNGQFMAVGVPSTKAEDTTGRHCEHSRVNSFIGEVSLAAKLKTIDRRHQSPTSPFHPHPSEIPTPDIDTPSEQHQPTGDLRSLTPSRQSSG
jgi:hypothetical protein